MYCVKGEQYDSVQESLSKLRDWDYVFVGKRYLRQSHVLFAWVGNDVGEGAMLIPGSVDIFLAKFIKTSL